MLKEAYTAFHTEIERVDKYKKIFCIGQIDPSDEMPNSQMNAKERARIERRNAIREDFEKLRNLAIEKVRIIIGYIVFCRFPKSHCFKKGIF